MHISKELIFRVYEGLLCSVIIKWQLKTAKYLNKYFTKDEIKLGNKQIFVTIFHQKNLLKRDTITHLLGWLKIKKKKKAK